MGSAINSLANYLDQEAEQKLTDADSKLVYSVFSGYNFYSVPIDYTGEKACPGIHENSRTSVRIVPIEKNRYTISQRKIFWYEMFVMRPMQQKYIEWPIDLVESECGDGYVLSYVFPLRAYPGFVPIKTLLYQNKMSEKLDWRREEILEIALNLAKVLNYLHQKGFLYNDFSPERIYFHEQSNQILFRNTTSIRTISQRRELDRIELSMISCEFASPYYLSKQYDGYGSIKTDYYSLSAMIFRLMIGRLPYEGKGLSGIYDAFDPVRDTDAEAHRDYFDQYLRYPYFIFDRENDCNELGAMSENDLPRERWEQLPESIKQLFAQCFCEDFWSNTSDPGYRVANWIEMISSLRETVVKGVKK